MIRQASACLSAPRSAIHSFSVAPSTYSIAYQASFSRISPSSISRTTYSDWMFLIARISRAKMRREFSEACSQLSKILIATVWPSLSRVAR